MSSEKRRYHLRARAESQRATRRRIIEAASRLHEEVGPALTTIAEVARRAGVQRLTVYTHFPEERELFAACGAHWLEANPPPNFLTFAAVAPPAERLRAFLRAFYSWISRNEAGLMPIQRDRWLLPALDDAAREVMDAQLKQLADMLAEGFSAGGSAEGRTRAAIGLALDFWTWKRLRREGLDDVAAADLMVDTAPAASRDASC